MQDAFFSPFTKLSMKKPAFLFAISSSVLLTSFLDKSEPDFNEMAQDICNCVNESSDGISDKLKTLIIQSEKDGTDLEIALQNYLIEDESDAATEDVRNLDELGDNMEICAAQIEEKYSTVFSSQSEEQIIKNLIGILKGKQGCEFTYALIQLGVKAEESSE